MGERGPLAGNQSTPRRRTDPPPEPPAWLIDEACDEWARIVPELWAAGTIEEIDLGILAWYCQCFGRLCNADDALNHGLVYDIRSAKGELKSSQPVAEFGVAMRLLDKVRQFAAEFGLTPRARARLGKSGDGDDQANPFLEMLKKRNGNGGTN